MLFRLYWKNAERLLNQDTPFFAPPSKVAPLTFAMSAEWHFHDTLSQAFNIIGGWPFPEEMLDCYDHINAGTYAELVDNRIPGFKERVLKYLDNPETLRGRWREEEKWYAEHAP